MGAEEGSGATGGEGSANGTAGVVVSAGAYSPHRKKPVAGPSATNCRTIQWITQLSGLSSPSSSATSNASSRGVHSARSPRTNVHRIAARKPWLRQSKRLASFCVHTFTSLSVPQRAAGYKRGMTPGCDVPSCTLPFTRPRKPRASGLPGRPTPAHAATPVAFVCVAGGFSPTGRGALHDGTAHP